ncbi:MAG: LPS export ABC transporter periplasmic protein LptC [Alphaproteobacteria bacterium]|jgi:lipopolysaccharide export system protein LptC|nr:LPS export ABC transporter periplasmic protein LptC [Alphaproteobacteria bacterium]
MSNTRTFIRKQSRHSPTKALDIRQNISLLKKGIVAVVFVLLGILLFWPYLSRVSYEPQDLRNSTSELKEEIEKKLVMNPHYEGVDEKNRPYEIKAVSALNETEDRVRLNHPYGSLTLEDGTFMTLKANEGVFHSQDRELTLKGNVILNHDGYVFETTAVDANIANKTAQGVDPVWGYGGYGKIYAKEGFEMIGAKIRFKGRPHLTIYNSPSPETQMPQKIHSSTSGGKHV